MGQKDNMILMTKISILSHILPLPLILRESRTPIPLVSRLTIDKHSSSFWWSRNPCEGLSHNTDAMHIINVKSSSSYTTQTSCFPPQGSFGGRTGSSPNRTLPSLEKTIGDSSHPLHWHLFRFESSFSFGSSVNILQQWFRCVLIVIVGIGFPFFNRVLAPARVIVNIHGSRFRSC